MLVLGGQCGAQDGVCLGAAAQWTTAARSSLQATLQNPPPHLKRHHNTLLCSTAKLSPAGPHTRPAQQKAMQRTAGSIGAPKVLRLARQQLPGGCRVGQQLHRGHVPCRGQQVHALLRQAVMHQLPQLDHLMRPGHRVTTRPFRRVSMSKITRQGTAVHCTLWHSCEVECKTFSCSNVDGAHTGSAV